MGRSGRATWAWGALCALVLLLAPHRSRAQSDHRLVWRSLSTEHFDIHYHEPLGLLARRFAAEAEAINARIERALGLHLRQRVQLALADDDDSANGFAGPVPYNAIHLRVVAPDDLSPLADYDDWPTVLLTHEHTHILHLEEASGIPRLLQRVLGRFYTPQQSLPGWFIEGLAVVEESAQTTAGRVRGTLFDMYLRTDALEDRLLGLDWIGFEGEPWPHGNVRYLYGQGFLQFIADRYGQAALGTFAKEYGRRLIPYGINRALKRATGRTFVELYPEFLAQLRQRAEATLREVEARGRIEGKRLTQHGEVTRTPRFLSDEQIVYSVADARHVPDLRKLSLKAPEAWERLSTVGNVVQSSRVPGRDELVFSMVDFHRGTYGWNELFAFDMKSRKRTKLTHAMRAREPDVSPDGKQIAYVVHGAGTSHLEIAELADIEHTRKLVVQSRRLEQVFTPRWSPDGKRIAYSAWSTGGYRDIWVLDVETGVRMRITYDRALDRGPVFSPDGRTLYFSSDRTGISNLYAYRFDSGELSQLTNVATGAFQPDVSPDGKNIVYVGYNKLGFDLYALDLTRVAPLPALPSFERPPLPALPEPVVAQSKPYEAFRSLYPRYYEISTDDPGNGTRLTLTSTGRDVVGWHSWSLFLAQSLERDERVLDLGYAYQRPRFPLFVRGTIAKQERTDLVVSRRYHEWDARAWSLSVGSSFSFPRPLRALVLRGDYVASFLEKTRDFDVPLDPNYPPPKLPRTGYDARLNTSITHSTSQRQPFDISRSWGHTATLASSLRNPLLGSSTRDVGLSWRFEQFVRFDFRESVIALAYTGAWKVPVALGGYPAQLVPVFDYITGSKTVPGDYARLRGFERRVGDRLEVVQLEYRVLLSRINRGIETLPLFARRVHAALFSDIGHAYTDKLVLSEIGACVGAELRLDWSTEYGNNMTLRGGIAQGLTRGGELQWYTTIAAPF